ncbi:hypothetical protein [Shimazuella kribbensis]|uniref:hypothetical protein n=1 Tax=Shimazuella kribbensis TaxID=139808 RepID=UPI00042A5457|nr:hypothetical protein [Shimazuella kribbensis]
MSNFAPFSLAAENLQYEFEFISRINQLIEGIRDTCSHVTEAAERRSDLTDLVKMVVQLMHEANSVERMHKKDQCVVDLSKTYGYFRPLLDVFGQVLVKCPESEVSLYKRLRELYETANELCMEFVDRGWVDSLLQRATETCSRSIEVAERRSDLVSDIKLVNLVRQVVELAMPIEVQHKKNKSVDCDDRRNLADNLWLLEQALNASLETFSQD